MPCTLASHDATIRAKPVGIKVPAGYGVDVGRELACGPKSERKWTAVGIGHSFRNRQRTQRIKNTAANSLSLLSPSGRVHLSYGRFSR